MPLDEKALRSAIREVTAESVLDALERPPADWRGFTFHHSYAPHLPEWGVNYAVLFNRFHFRHRKWDGGLGYHLLVSWNVDSPAGFIAWASHRWVFQRPGAHAVNDLKKRRGFKRIDPNAETIGVCVVGDYSSYELPDPVYRNLINLLLPVMHSIERRHKTRFYRHDQFQNKNCPGQHFRHDLIKEGLLEAINGNDRQTPSSQRNDRRTP